jgi:hypothetical protein
MGRDFLGSKPAEPTGSNPDQLLRLMSQQSNYLDEISVYLRRQNADVLCSAVVRGTSQLSNTITDNKCHEIVFEVGGKPVEVYKLLIFSTLDGVIAVSPLSMATIRDGIQLPLNTGVPLVLEIGLHSLWVITAVDLSANPLVVNGPAGTPGGLFVYGFTAPDWDKIRNSIRE